MLRTLSAFSAALALSVAALAAAPAHAAPGNNGTVKIAGIDDVGTPSNDPHVGCTFSVEWTGFDDAAVSTVTFESQAPTADAAITVLGPTSVHVSSGTVRQDYTLTFAGTPASQGYHVKLTTDTTGSKGADSKSKVFWVEPCDSSGSTPVTSPAESVHCGALDSGVLSPATPSDAVLVTAPTGKVVTGYCVLAGGKLFSTTLATPAEQTWIQDPAGGTVTEYALSYAAAGTPVTPEENPGHAAPAGAGFDWNWTYPAPTCSALSVSYPGDLPSGQSNDVNIKIRYPRPDGSGQAEKTLNFHNDLGTWSGKKSFVYGEHRDWPAGVTTYSIVWTQVAGTNFHWGAQGEKPVQCSTDGDPETVDLPQTLTSLAAPASLSATVGQDDAVESVSLTGGSGTAARTLQLQELVDDTWTTVSSARSSAAGTARMAVPTATAGTATYRVVAPATARNHSTVSRAFTVVTTAAPAVTTKAPTVVKTTVKTTPKTKPTTTVAKHAKAKKKHAGRKHRHRAHR